MHYESLSRRIERIRMSELKEGKLRGEWGCPGGETSCIIRRFEMWHFKTPHRPHLTLNARPCPQYLNLNHYQPQYSA